MFRDAFKSLVIMEDVKRIVLLSNDLNASFSILVLLFLLDSSLFKERRRFTWDVSFSRCFSNSSSSAEGNVTLCNYCICVHVCLRPRSFIVYAGLRMFKFEYRQKFFMHDTFTLLYARLYMMWIFRGILKILKLKAYVPHLWLPVKCTGIWKYLTIVEWCRLFLRIHTDFVIEILLQQNFDQLKLLVRRQIGQNFQVLALFPSHLSISIWLNYRIVRLWFIKT